MVVIDEVGGIRKGRAARGVLVGAVAAGAVAMGSAPVAGATCVSAFGLGNTAECSSTIASVAIALGTGAEAHADGLLGAAFAAGDGAQARTADAFTFAVAGGTQARAISGGFGGIAIQLGANGLAAADGPALNIAVNIADAAALPGPEPEGAWSEAWGVGNVAVNLFGNAGTSETRTYILAWGTATASINLGGYETQVRPGLTPGTLNLGFAVSGSNNTVTVGPGPLAIAGSVAQTGATVTKVGPGININGFVIGGAASEKAPAVTARQSKRTGPAAASSAKAAPRSAAAARSARKK